MSFGICALNNFIYVGGGYTLGKITDSLERFDNLKNCWEKLDYCKLPYKIQSHNFLALRNRFIYSIGNEIKVDNYKSQIEVVLRLDTFNLAKGWTESSIFTPYTDRGC